MGEIDPKVMKFFLILDRLRREQSAKPRKLRLVAKDGKLS